MKRKLIAGMALVCADLLAQKEMFVVEMLVVLKGGFIAPTPFAKKRVPWANCLAPARQRQKDVIALVLQSP